MSEITYPIRVICAHGTEQEWADANPILKSGEIGVSYDGTDGPRLKVGDGVTDWNHLLWMVADQHATFELADNYRIGVPNGGTGQVTFTSGFLKANGTNPFSTVPNIVENDLSFSDVTTGNASTTKHGFLPKLNNDDTYFLSGKGTWAVPEYMYPTGISGSSSGSVLSLSIGYRSNLSSDGITTPAYNLTGATDSAAGLVTTGAQTFAGTKTFSGGIVSNVTGNVTGNADTSTTVRTEIKIVTDLNSLLDPGEYYIPQNAVQSTTLNVPSDLSSSDGLIVRVYEPVYIGGTSTYGLRLVQFAIGSASGKVYVRTITRANTSSTFTYNSWKQLNFKSDVDNILNGTTTFAGTKTFTSDIVGNLSGNASSSDKLFRNDISVTDQSTRDLNDYYIPGLYNFYYATSSRVANSPIYDDFTGEHYVRGFLEVFSSNNNPTDGSSVCGFQRFTYHGITGSDTNLKKFAKTYVRGFYKRSTETFSEMTFTEWKSLLDQNDISSLETSISNILDGTSTVGYTNKLRLTLLSSNSRSVDLNEVIEPGFYYGYYTTNPSGTGISHTNFPSDLSSNRMYYVHVDNYSYSSSGTSHSNVIQRLYSAYSNDAIYYIRNLSYDGSTNPATISGGTWFKIATNSDISNILTGNITLSGTKTFSSNIVGNLSGNATTSTYADQIKFGTYISATSSFDLDTYTNTGRWYGEAKWSSSDRYPLNIPDSPVSVPSSGYTTARYFYLEVLCRGNQYNEINNVSSALIYGIQKVTFYNTGQTWIRQFHTSSGNTTFEAWKEFAFKESIDNILNGNITFSGTKTFSSTIVGNLSGNAGNADRLRYQTIDLNDDLNSYYIPGLYIAYSATSTSPVNSPIPSNLDSTLYIRLYLEVFNSIPSPTSNSSFVGFQRATYHWYSGTSTNAIRTYIRGFYKQSADSLSSLTFTPWRLVLDERDISSLTSSLSNILDGTTTFAGTKTFSSNIVGNLTGTASNATKDENGRNIASGYLYRGSYERIQGTSSSHKDLDSYTDPGFYNVKTAYVDHCPSGIGVDAVLLVYPWGSTNTVGSSNGTYILQELTEGASSTDNRRWIRCNNNGTFSTWKQIAFTTSDITGTASKAINDENGNNIYTKYLMRRSYEKIAGTSSTHKDLNTYYVPGFYSVTTTYTDNCPEGIGTYGLLIVYPYSTSATAETYNGNYPIQEIIECSGSSTNKRWVRSCNNGTFSTWKRMLDNNDYTTLDTNISTTSTTLSTLSTGLSNRGVYPGAKLLSGDFDFNDITDHGDYYIGNYSGNISNYPGTKTFGWLQVKRGNGANMLLQIFKAYDTSSSLDFTGGSKLYIRNRSTTTWYAWKEIALRDVGISYESGDNVSKDLNNYIEPGTYGFGSSVAGHSSSQNFPSSSNGLLLVWSNTGHTVVTQLYIVYQGANMFIRGGASGGTWSEWKPLGYGYSLESVDVSSSSSAIKTPNSGTTWEYCIYEFDSSTKAFTNFYCGTKAKNTSIVTASTSKIYKGWYRRLL